LTRALGCAFFLEPWVAASAAGSKTRPHAYFGQNLMRQANATAGLFKDIVYTEFTIKGITIYLFSSSSSISPDYTVGQPERQVDKRNRTERLR